MYRDNVILLTGAFTGIGRALTRLYMKERARLLAVGRNDDQEIPSFAGHYLPIVRDIRTDEDAEDVVDFTLEKYHRIDRIVHCAGSLQVKTVQELRRGDLERAMTDNFYTAAHITRHALRKMRPQRTGHFIFLDDSRFEQSMNGFAAHLAAKSALRGFVDVLRNELADTNFCISLLELPPVDSHYWDAAEDLPCPQDAISVNEAARRIFELGHDGASAIQPSASMQSSA